MATAYKVQIPALTTNGHATVNGGTRQSQAASPKLQPADTSPAAKTVAGSPKGAGRRHSTVRKVLSSLGV